MNSLWSKLREFVVHRILHLDDTPERIALGVALGFFVAWTPTIGLQMIIYVLLATVFNANKLSGIGPVWLTNPLTAVPIYGINWWVGNVLVNGFGSRVAEGKNEAASALKLLEGTGSVWDQLFQAAFWKRVGAALLDMGLELWLGSFVVGAVFGVVSYFVTLRAVVVFREAKERRRSLRPSSPSLRAKPGKD